jgi:hypothetical protein
MVLREGANERVEIKCPSWSVMRASVEANMLSLLAAPALVSRRYLHDAQSDARVKG